MRGLRIVALHRDAVIIDLHVAMAGRGTEALVRSGMRPRCEQRHQHRRDEDRERSGGVTSMGAGSGHEPTIAAAR